VYGFRNIQSVVQALKRGKCVYDFVEVMACPGGCLNGGGQLKLTRDEREDKEGKESGVVEEEGGSGGTGKTESPVQMKQRIALIEKVFHDCTPRRPELSPLAQWLYDDTRLKRPRSEQAIKLLHTGFHVVPKLEEIAPLAVKW